MSKTIDLAEAFERLWANGSAPDLEAFVARAGIVDAAQLSRLARIDQAERWQRGDRRTAEEYLERYPVLQANHDGAVDLIYHEYLLREKLAERPSLEDFTSRFPRHATVLAEQVALHRALVCASANVSDTCVIGAPGETSFDTHDDPGNIYEDTAGERGAKLPLAERPGKFIGPYKLLNEIGEGGMGVVYMADQQAPVRRRVALKVIKAGMDTRQVIARFEAERQTLALMEHSNIARVFDAGATEAGHPYFVMELVRGIPITAYCDAHRLNIRERLEMFVQVCHAVQHAHQKGIIHRDIKPSNVLVAQCDGRAVPKVIDFGLAKATGPQLTGQTQFTAFAQMVGTPLYMSPEQSEMTSLDIDTRADIYSLGVLLYELLTGTTPFDQARIRAAGLDEIRRIIREEEPPRPSLRIALPGETGPAAAARSAADARRLRQLVTGDLDWIVMKCLEKDRSRRYETTSALAQDIEHYLTDEPVAARRPTWSYRLKKFVRRNKLLVLTAASIAMALITGLITLLVSLAQIRGALSAKDAALATARRAVDQMLTRTAAEKLANVPLAQTVRRELMEDALGFYQDFVAQAEGDVTVKHELARVLSKMGGIQSDLARITESRRSYERSINVLEQLVAAEPDERSYREDLATSESSLAYLLLMTPGFSRQEAVDHFQNALTIYEELEKRWPNHLQPRANVLYQLGQIENWAGHQAEAEQLYRDAIVSGEKYLFQQPDKLHERSLLCWTYQQLAHLVPAAEAESLYRSGARHADTLLALNPKEHTSQYAAANLSIRLGNLYCATNRYELAVPMFEKGVKQMEAACSIAPTIKEYWGGVGFAHWDAFRNLREPDRSRLARVMIDWVDQIAPHIPDDLIIQSYFLTCCIELSGCLRTAHLASEADELTRVSAPKIMKFIQNWRVSRADESQTAHLSVGVLMRILVFAVQNVEYSGDSAMPEFQQYVLDLVDHASARDFQFGTFRGMIRQLVRDRTTNIHPAKVAVRLVRRAADLFPDDASFANILGIAYYREGSWQPAIESLNKSVQLQGGGDALDWYFLSMAHWQLGHKVEARTWYEKAVVWMDKNRPENEELLRFRDEASDLISVSNTARSTDE